MTTETRVAGGMQMKKKGEPVLYGPVRDEGAPSEPRKLDSSAGLMQEDESIRSLQWGEGMEEVVWIEEGTLLLPDIVRDTPVEQRVIDEYNTAATADSNDLSPVTADEVAYIDAEITVPAEMDVMRFGEYRTGIVEQPPVTEDDITSMELVNYLELDVPDSASPVDLEHMPGDDGINHFDRPVYELNVETAETAIYQGGQKLYDGDLEGALAYIEDEDGLDWDPLPDTPATVKVQGAIQYGPAEEDDRWDVHEQVEEYLLV